MRLESTTFGEGEQIPRNQGYKNGNQRPGLEVLDIPPNTSSLALIMDDPDAVAAVGKKWVHWTLWNIPPENAQISKDLAQQIIEGKTDFGEVGYGGPAPPDREHVYVFTVYALDSALELESGSIRKELDSAMEGHIIETATLRGRYAP